MRPTSAILLLLPLLTVSACGPSSAPGGPTTTSTAIPVDLSDPATQSALGSPTPTDIEWQRATGELTILGQTASADPSEITLLTAAIADLPVTLKAAVEPRSVVRVHDVTGAEDISSAVTVSVGPDIYLLDRTFLTDAGQTSKLDLTYALAHEYAHVAQWFTLDDSYVRDVLSGAIARVQLGAGAKLVQEFADATGWVNLSTNALEPDWHLEEGTSPSEYASSSPVEDLAETVALAAIGRGNWLDDARRQWVSVWLGVSVDALSMGKPWLPAGSHQVSPTVPLFDELAAADLAAELGREHVEPASFIVTGSTMVDLAQLVQEHLDDRGLTGTLGSVVSSEPPRFQGSFRGSSGSGFLVDVRTVTGPDNNEDVVLTYVTIW